MSRREDRKWRKAEGELEGFVPLADWPTVEECKQFNRRAAAWLRKRGEQTGIDDLKFGKQSDEAGTD